MSDRFQFRWGIPEWDVGSTDIPNPIFQYYSKIPWTNEDGESGVGITNTEAMFILHLASFHFESKRGKAMPSLTHTLKERMGYKTNQGIINVMESLESKGLITVQRNPGQRSIYNFQPFSERIMILWRNDNPSTKVDDHLSTKVDPKKKKENKKNTTLLGAAEKKAGRDWDDLCRETLKARAKEGEWTVPNNGLVGVAIKRIYERLGSNPPRQNSGTWQELINKLAPVLADYGIKDAETVKIGIDRFHADSPKTFKPFYKSFPGELGIYLSGNGEKKKLDVGY